MKQNKLALAFAIVGEAFKTKLDKGGKPYMLHCIYVMEGANPDDEDEQIAGLCHDLVEDTSWTIEMLRQVGFSERALLLIDTLTHKPGQSYDDYIKLCALNESTRRIKKRDLRHNSDITRIKGISKDDFDRIEKYHRSFLYLS